MRIMYDLYEMTETARGWLAAGSVGLVHVNGNLHAGHLALVRSSLKECEISVVCIFENNLQFECDETLTRIPLRLAANLEALDQERVDVVFIPRPYDFYPTGFSTHVGPFGPVAKRLEGAIEPENMRKVATSMTKLFQLVRPDKLYLGQKKAQQVTLIRKLVSDLNIDIRVLPTVRDTDGVAVGNHVRLLSQAERQAAVLIYRSLLAGKSLIEKCEHDTTVIKKEIVDLIGIEPLLKLDYVAICDPQSFPEFGESLGTNLPDLLLAISIRVGVTRLIDNILWSSNGFWLT
jgi:pantoate--beta-alanine ligase